MASLDFEREERSNGGVDHVGGGGAEAENKVSQKITAHLYFLKYLLTKGLELASQF